MALIIGIVIGLLIGAGLIYLMLSKSLSQKTQELEQANRTIDELERTRELRLREATEALQRDYQRKLDQQVREAQAGDSAGAAPPAASPAAPPPAPSTRIQSTNQTTIQSDDPPSEPADSPTPDSPAPESSPAESNAPASNTPAAQTDVPARPSPPEPSPASPVADASAPSPETETSEVASPPLAQPTQPEVSFVRSGLTEAQRQDLIRVVLNMGKSKQMSHLPELQRLSLFSSSDVREVVAIAIGEIASANSHAPAIRQTVPLLGKLSQDPDSKVRFMALEGLGSISSSRVLPYVRRLLRDPDMKVVGAAQTVMDRFKYYRSASSPSTRAKKNKTKKKSYGSKPNG